MDNILGSRLKVSIVFYYALFKKKWLNIKTKEFCGVLSCILFVSLTTE